MPFIIDAVKLTATLVWALVVYLGKLGFETQRIVIYRDLPLPVQVFENDPQGAADYRRRVSERLRPWKFNLHGWSKLTRMGYEDEWELHFQWV